MSKIRGDFELMAGAEVRVLRFGMAWDAIEPFPGQFNWAFWDQLVIEAQRRGIRLIPYLCYSPRWASSAPEKSDYWRWPPKDVKSFEQLSFTAARHYRGAITSWELWNEPDNSDYWRGTVRQYAAMVRAGSRGVRKAEPTDSVVLGGLSWNLNFLKSLLVQEHLSPAIDVVNVHSYFETWIPGSIEDVSTEVNKAAELTQRFGNRQPVWLAETGYSNYRKGAVVSDQCSAAYRYEHTAQYQAQVLVRTFVCAAATNRARLVAWYRINDLPIEQNVIGDVNNRYLGLRTAGGAAKPAVAAMRLMSQLFCQSFADIDDQMMFAARRPCDMQLHLFVRQDGSYWLTAWLNTAVPQAHPAETAVGDAIDLRDETIVLTVPKPLRISRVEDAQGEQLPSPRIKHGANGTTLKLGLRGNLTELIELLPL